MRFPTILASLLVVATAPLAWSAPIILNNSFENPNIGSGFQEGTPPTNWTYVGPGGTSGGGIVGNGSAYGNSNAPDGTQALLLKSSGGASQTLSGFVAGGQYEISFYAEARTNDNGPDPFQVLIDGTPITFSGNATVTPLAGFDHYVMYTSQAFIVASATPTLEFNGLSGSDNSSFVDLVTAQAVPEPSAIVALVGLCSMGLVGLVRRRRRAA